MRTDEDRRARNLGKYSLIMYTKRALAPLRHWLGAKWWRYKLCVPAKAQTRLKVCEVP